MSSAAVTRGRADRLRESINNQIEDESRKKSLIDALDSEQIGVAAYRGQTEELQKLLPQIRLKEVRARAMAEIAILLEKKGDHDEALKLLDDAQALIKVDLKSQHALTNIYSPSHAIAMTRPRDRRALITFEKDGVLLDRDFPRSARHAAGRLDDALGVAWISGIEGDAVGSQLAGEDRDLHGDTENPRTVTGCLTQPKVFGDGPMLLKMRRAGEPTHRNDDGGRARDGSGHLSMPSDSSCFY